MKSRGVRIVLLLVAVAALAAAGVGVWQIEQRMAMAQSTADDFERDARQAVVALGDWRAAQQAYVAEGQPPEAWMTKAAALGEAIGPRISALRTAAKTAAAQGVMESAVEAFTSLMQSDARARDYVKSGQRLSASDIIFVEAAPAIEKAVVGIDTARGQERVAHAVAIEGLRRWEVIALGAAAGVALLVMVLLLPIPSGPEASDATASPDDEVIIPKGGGLHLSQDLADGVVRRAQPVPDGAPAGGMPPASAAAKTPPAPAPASPGLDAVADLCSSLARVQDTRELQALLERTAKALDATGVIVWMPDGPQGTLRPVLAHGYASLALSRMGIIHPAADNATATAYRTKSVVVVPAETLASGAVVAPLISSEGCSGAMAVELREGVEASSNIRAMATIVAAQLATMFTPGSVTSVPQGAVVAPEPKVAWDSASGKG
jgi:hypothetical protein